MKLKVFPFLISMFFCLGLAAQEQELTPEQQEKKIRETLDQVVLKMEESLKLETWQTFYVDSILTYNYAKMQEEMMELSMNKVENPDLFVRVQDKWEEENYRAIGKVLDEEQWKKYLKQGAARAKKARDKREAKRNKQAQLTK